MSAWAAHADVPDGASQTARVVVDCWRWEAERAARRVRAVAEECGVACTPGPRDSRGLRVVAMFDLAGVAPAPECAAMCAMEDANRDVRISESALREAAVLRLAACEGRRPGRIGA